MKEKIINLQKLSLSDLNELTRKAVKVANQQIRRLEKKGYATRSMAYLSLQKHTGKSRISYSQKWIKEKNARNKLIKAYYQAMNYRSLKTGSVRGYKSQNKQILERLGIDKFNNKDQESKFWEVYRNLENYYPYMALDRKHHGSDVLVQITADLFAKADKRKSANKMINDFSEKLTQFEMEHKSLYAYFDKSLENSEEYQTYDLSDNQAYQEYIKDHHLEDYINNDEDDEDE